MLDTTRSATYTPGSNRIGSASGVPWLALLPSQEPGRVLAVGLPSLTALRALGRASGSLTVRCRSRREARRARAILAGTGASVEMGSAGGTGYDLIVVARGAPSDGLSAALGPGGTLIREESGTGAGIALTPSFGEVTAAAPASAPNARHALERRGLWSGRVVLRALGRSRDVGGPWERLLHARRLVSTAEGPPAYLCRVAADAGIDVSGMDWAMSAPGRYRSNKIVFFLFERGAEVPAIAVKMTRDPELNGRLAIERDALERLAATGAMPAGAIPTVSFAGVEAGRALLGLGAVDGVPFASVSERTSECPHLAAAFVQLESLAAATAEPAAGSELGALLRDILERFRALYRLSDGHRAVLEAGIAAIEASPAPVPAVFQHGDPGVWNLLVAADGTVAFLDWEAAESRGVPLWDVFHLARSYAVMAGRAAGERYPMRSIERLMITPGPINEMLGDVVRRYRDRIGVEPGLVEPLFHASWMHRALKEATRLAPGRLEGGHYLALLRYGIDERATPGMRRLVGEEAG